MQTVALGLWALSRSIAEAREPRGRLSKRGPLHEQDTERDNEHINHQRFDQHHAQQEGEADLGSRTGISRNSLAGRGGGPALGVGPGGRGQRQGEGTRDQRPLGAGLGPDARLPLRIHGSPQDEKNKRPESRQQQSSFHQNILLSQSTCRTASASAWHLTVSALPEPLHRRGKSWSA